MNMEIVQAALNAIDTELGKLNPLQALRDELQKLGGLEAAAQVAEKRAEVAKTNADRLEADHVARTTRLRAALAEERTTHDANIAREKAASETRLQQANDDRAKAKQELKDAADQAQKLLDDAAAERDQKTEDWNRQHVGLGDAIEGRKATLFSLDQQVKDRQKVLDGINASLAAIAGAAKQEQPK